MGLSSTGLTIKRLSEIRESMRLKAEELFSDLAVTSGVPLDTGDGSTIGRIIGTTATEMSTLWEQVQYVYDSFNPAAAEGYSLDNMILLSRITRKKAQATRTSVVLSGEYGITVPALTKFQSSATKKFYSLTDDIPMNEVGVSSITYYLPSVVNGDEYTISRVIETGVITIATYTCTPLDTNTTVLDKLKSILIVDGFSVQVDVDKITIISPEPFFTASYSNTSNITPILVSKIGIVVGDEIGVIEQAANTIDTIPIVISGLNSVTNPEQATTGNLRETDILLRERWRNQKFVSAGSIYEALIENIIGIDGVEDITLLENDSDTTDANGLPPHSFMALVKGGSSTDIASSIFNTAPIGITSHGNVLVSVADRYGNPHNIKFSRPVEIPVYIDIQITDTGELSSSYETDMKNAIISSVTSSVSTGDTLYYSRLFTPVNSVSGHYVNSMYIGTSPLPSGTSNITPLYNEILVVTADNINIQVV